MRAPDLEELAEQAAMLAEGPFQALLPTIRAYSESTVPYGHLYKLCRDILGEDAGFKAFHWLTYTYKEMNGSSSIIGVGYDYPKLMRTIQSLIDKGISFDGVGVNARP